MYTNELKEQLAKSAEIINERQKKVMEEVGTAVGSMGAELHALHDTADEALTAGNKRLDKLENEDDKGSQNRSLINPKHMTVVILD